MNVFISVEIHNGIFVQYQEIMAFKQNVYYSNGGLRSANAQSSLTIAMYLSYAIENYRQT